MYCWVAVRGSATVATRNDDVRDVKTFVNADDLTQAAGRRFVELASEAIAQRQRFLTALSGGRTPRLLYELLATDAFVGRIDWSRVEVLFTDERCVPPDHPDSNYGMAAAALLDRVPIPPTNVHRIRGELPPTDAAVQYREELRRVLGVNGRFDLMLLGMGTDGHTASLFPASGALEEGDKEVVATYVEALQAWRITLTLPVINVSRHVAFLVGGSEKAAALSRVLSGEPLPAGRVKPEAGALTWFVSRDAADCVDL